MHLQVSNTLSTVCLPWRSLPCPSSPLNLIHPSRANLVPFPPGSLLSSRLHNGLMSILFKYAVSYYSILHLLHVWEFSLPTDFQTPLGNDLCHISLVPPKRTNTLLYTQWELNNISWFLVQWGPYKKAPKHWKWLKHNKIWYLFLR